MRIPMKPAVIIKDDKYVAGGEITTTYPEEYEIDTGFDSIKAFSVSSVDSSGTIVGISHFEPDFQGYGTYNYCTHGGNWGYSTYWAQVNAVYNFGSGPSGYAPTIKAVNGGKVTIIAPQNTTVKCTWFALKGD